VQKEETKRQIIARLVDEVTDLGVRHLVGQLKKTTVENIAAELDIEHHSKVVLGKRLYERIVETGVSQFFESKVDIQDLRDICDTLGINVESKDAKYIAKAIYGEAMITGLEILLSTMQTSDLQTMCHDLKLKADTESKAKLMECVIFRRGYTKKAAPVAVERRSSKKPKIQAGIHATNLRSWYTKPELVEWCNENDVTLLSSLKKEEVIRRILKSFEEGKENSSSAANKNKSAPSSPKKNTSPKKTKKEEKKEESSEEEEPSENVEMKEEEPSQMEVDEDGSAESEADAEELGDNLKGKVFAITGKFDMERKEMIALIEKRGGSVKSSITKDVQYLLCADGDSESAKVVKARQEGVKILGSDFLAQLE
jgi:hypothetical protein